MLAVFMIGFLVGTFILETIILAANDWTVSRSTPVYNFVYTHTHVANGFCSLFWATLLWYFVMGALAFFTGVFLTGFFDMWVYWQTGDAMGLGWATLYTITVVSAIVGMSWVNDKWERFNQKSNEIKLAKGISNWCIQVRDKFCPIVTKEED